MLATLYKDERCQQLPAYNILEKMYLDRLIKHSELVSVFYNSFSSFRDGGENLVRISIFQDNVIFKIETRGAFIMIFFTAVINSVP